MQCSESSANNLSMNIEQMKERLKLVYPDSILEVIDLTGTEDHYEVYIESIAFKDLSRIEQHQAVMKAFDEELKSGEVHALSIRTKVKS